MPNFVGIWDQKSTEQGIRQALKTQLHRVRIPGITTNDCLLVEPGLGVALMDTQLLMNGEQPARSPDGRLSLFIDGELYNASELKRSFRSSLPDAELSTAELCVHLIAIHGEEVVRRFNGLFSLVMYDSVAKRLLLISDRYGFRPLFIAQRDSCLLFGSEMKALCAADTRQRHIDEIGTVELFCYGTCFAQQTLIQGYTRLAPATILTADSDGVRFKKYWSYKYEEGGRALDQPTYFSVFGTLLDRAVERCMQGSRRIGILLSGGYDSRAVAASIRKHHLPISAFTFGRPESRDVRFATMLAERLGLDHVALTNPGAYLHPSCHSVVWRTEGMLSFANTTSIRFHREMKEKMDVFLTGILAEFGGSHTWPALLVARSRQQAIQAIFDRILGTRLRAARRVFNPQYFDRVLEGVNARFRDSFSAVLNDHPLNIADSWNVIHLQPRGTYHAPSIDRPRFEVRAPQMDAELVDFLLTIPPAARLEQRVYKKMIAFHFPEIRDVPCTNSGRPIDPRFATEYTRMTMGYGGRKAASLFRKVLHRNAPLGREFRDLNDDFRAEPELMDKVLKPLLQAGVFPPAIFNLSAIEAIIDEHYNKRGKHENILSLLISWGLGIKYFVHDDLSDVPEAMYQA
jgi:asparagine synthase (glutamine-hydrolysing)